jgi:arginine N-succinyltransferase
VKMIQLDDIFIRPIQASDYETVLLMARFAQEGMTNLPKNSQDLKEKITYAITSFQKPTIDDAQYLFVMEHIPTKEVIGISGIIAQIGSKHPLFHFNLNLYKPTDSKEVYFDTLHLDSYFKGPTEICTLYVRPEFRGSGIGRMLSLHRFLFMTPHQSLFDTRIIAEMRGVSNKQGFSPFYAYVWEKRFGITFPEADTFCAKHPSKITEFAPRYPIEIHFLSDWAQDVIGKPHKNTEAAHALLLKQGFVFNNKVCMLDAGPILECELSQIELVKESRVARIDSFLKTPISQHKKEEIVMLSNGDISNYKACLAIFDGHSVSLPEHLQGVGFSINDHVMIAPLFSQNEPKGKISYVP